MNLLDDLTPDALAARSLSWSHPPLSWDSLPGGGIRVNVPPKVDYFQDPAGKTRKDDAPYLWLPVTGDFVARAHVRPTWTTYYDAGALMVYHDPQYWCKLCYEGTDFGTTAAVSVVTNGVSDDANGVDLSAPQLWLQVVRVENLFALHYALDGQSWRMVRYFSLPVPPAVRVGLVAQSPAGPGTTIDFLSFSVEARTVQNLRAGV